MISWPASLVVSLNVYLMRNCTFPSCAGAALLDDLTASTEAQDLYHSVLSHLLEWSGVQFPQSPVKPQPPKQFQPSHGDAVVLAPWTRPYLRGTAALPLAILHGSPQIEDAQVGFLKLDIILVVTF